MKVKDAFEIIATLKAEKEGRQHIIMGNPYHADFKHQRQIIINIIDEIYRINELVENMELEDSYDERTLNFLNKYEEALDE